MKMSNDNFRPSPRKINRKPRTYDAAAFKHLEGEKKPYQSDIVKQMKEVLSKKRAEWGIESDSSIHSYTDSN
jgi:hypothetical protein